VQEFLATEKEHNSGSLASYHVSSDKEDENDSCLDDHEPIFAPLELYVDFHEDEYEELSFQVDSLVPSSDDDKIQKEEQQISHVELNQHETLSLCIPRMVQEQFDEIPLQ